LPDVAHIEQLGTRGPSYGDRALGRVVLEELKADSDYPDVFDGVELSDDAEACIGRLPFYKWYVLVELTVSRGRGPESVFALHIPKSDRAQDEKTPSTLWLNGAAGSIYRANEVEAIELAEEHVLDYLRFFVNFLRGDEGPFTLIDATELLISIEKKMTATERLEFVATRERFMSGTLSDARETPSTPSRYEARFPIAYGSDFADLAAFKISNTGMVEMIASTADEGGQLRSVGTLSVLAIPTFPKISPAVLQARRAILPADREDPGALERRVADANELGEAGRQRPDPGDDEAKQYYDEAIELLQDIVSDYMDLLGPAYPDTIVALTYLDYWRLVKNWNEQSGGYGEEDLHEARRLLANQMRSLGSFHPRTLNTRRIIALMLTRNDGRSSGSADDAVGAWDRTGPAEAIAEFQGLIADIREHLSEDPLDDSSQRDKLEEILVVSRIAIAHTYHEMYTHHATEDDGAAIKDLKKLLGPRKSALPAVAKALSDAHYWLAEYLFDAGSLDEAIAESQARLAELRAADSPDERRICDSEQQLAHFEARRVGGGHDQE
jgi:tetratricopeptide (TPR) repeat protein